MSIFTRAIWLLGLISLFTDLASEALYPIMPIYLKEIGFSILLIGILEGIAEATAGLSKSYFGKWSDQTGKRVPFVRLGYFLSALSKPLMAAWAYPLWIFFARTLDRLGKGLRTGARDALLSAEATAQTKGRVFGLHRAMDTTGAVIGPALALLFLYFFPGQYKSLFLLAFIPGLAAVFLTFFLHDKSISQTTNPQKINWLISLQYWQESPVVYKNLLPALLFFTLFNSSDLFLLLRAKEAGLSDTVVIGIYIFYNLVYALFAYPMGRLGDKIGFKKTLIFGFLVYALVYAAMAFSHSLSVFLLLFFLYGIYAAATESIAKAWITTICPSNDSATAIGTYTGFQSIAAMLASSLAGGLWFWFGAQVTFLITASAAVLVVFYLNFNQVLKKEGAR